MTSFKLLSSNPNNDVIIQKSLQTVRSLFDLFLQRNSKCILPGENPGGGIDIPGGGTLKSGVGIPGIGRLGGGLFLK